MLKRLKQGFFQNETEKLLNKSNVDKTHDFFHPKYLGQIISLTSNPKTKNQLLNFLAKGLHSPNNSLKTKCLIILHACLRVNFDEEIHEFIMSQDLTSKSSQQFQEISYHDKEVYDFVRTNVIQYYLLYLKKVCTYRETISFIKTYIRSNLTAENKTKPQNEQKLNLEIASNGFTVLNLSRYLLQSSEMFNKLGRYHIEYQEIISMYIQVLRDLDLFNSYINKSANAILLENLQVSSKKGKEVKEVKDAKDGKEGTTTNVAVQEIKNLSSFSTKLNMSQQDEKVKHFFLYINQCQSVADRFYQFYHNRYFYKFVKNLVIFPPFLSIKNKEYSKLASKTRKVDKQLVRLVKMSKYQSPSPHQAILKTQASSSYSPLKSNNFKLSLTEISSSLMQNRGEEQVCQYLYEEEEKQ